VFENVVLRRIFGPKREAGWMRLHNKGLHNLYASRNIIRVAKSRRRWWGHVARMVEMRSAYNIWETLKGRDHSEDIGVDANIILE
jgi:hypothetical protein